MVDFMTAAPLQGKRFTGLSGSALKLVAAAAMIADHIAFLHLSPDSGLYAAMRTIGRMAFPIFALLVAEGFALTANKSRYFGIMFLFAILSVWPWHGLFGGGLNVMFTFVLAIMAMTAIDHLQEHKALAMTSAAVVCLAAEFLDTDYGAIGVGMVCVAYLLRTRTIFAWNIQSHYRSVFPRQTMLQIVMLFPLMCVYSIWGAVLAAIFMVMYDGRRGFIKGHWKYGFYLFYPLHMIILTMI